MNYGPLIVLCILVISAAAVALAYMEVPLVRGRLVARSFDRRFEANRQQRLTRRPRT